MSLSSYQIRSLLGSTRRDAVFLPAIAGLTAFAMSTTSTIQPTVLALAALHIYSRIIFPAEGQHHIALLVAALSVGSAIPNTSASLHALSTAATSLIILSILSFVTSAVTVGTLYTEWIASRHVASPYARALLFPAVWSMVWALVPHISPVGHLLTWSRANTLPAYQWLIPYMGASSQDWIAASWAVVLSEVYQVWYMGPQLDDSDDHDNLEANSTLKTRSSDTPFLAVILILLIIPSYFIGVGIPLPVGNIEEATAFGVGCIIPTFQRYKHHQPTLQDYIDETKKLQNRASFLLWPEGAVSFDSDAERDKAFAAVRANITGSFVGVSFEQYVTDPSDPRGRKSLKKTGIAVISKASKEPHLLYYKRHLVPVVESFQLNHSKDAPALESVIVPRPRDIPPSRWDPTGNRNITVTASVCLDFAMPDSFSHLNARPGLVLAPARTWERNVGIAMWLQARQRAAELDSMILWCDGGAGGVSGVAGGGFDNFEQVGPGSWVKNIGVQYPYSDTRTVYARWGESTLLLYWVGILSPRALQLLLTGAAAHGYRLVTLIRKRGRGERQPLLDNTPPLIDYL